MTTYIALFDKNAALLQWIGEASNIGQAVAAFNLDQLPDERCSADDFDAVTGLTDDEYDQIKLWWSNGGLSSKRPDCLK
jgi:hypothetical protein